jgi:ubiquinone/menaquinone biosynthesis C-methylase UbiE
MEQDFDFSHENIIRVLSGRWATTKLEKYLMEIKNNTKYYGPASNKQIHTVMKYGSLNDYYRLCFLISKFIGGHYGPAKHDIIEKILKRSKNDIEVYNKINVLFKEKYNINKSRNINVKSNSDIDFGNIYRDRINKYILKHNPNFVINKYLDFGCGTGDKAYYLGHAIGLDKKNIYGVDIEEWSSYYDKKRNPDITFNTYKVNEPMPYEDNMFDIISSFMVLHHIKKLGFVLAEINRCLKKGGYLILREHDLYNNIDYMITDIEHNLYSTITLKGEEDTKYDFYSRYFNWIELDVILDEYGFDYIQSNYDTANYKFDIGSTRFIYAIYKKR